MNPTTTNIMGLTCGEYVEWCVRAGHHGGRERAPGRYRLMFREGKLDQPHLLPEGMTLDAPKLRQVRHSESLEGVVTKFTLELDEQAPNGEPLEIESVIIPMIGSRGELNHTLCISSQVGCAMGCGFCQTAQLGRLANLNPAQIVSQWFAARHLLGTETIRNIVFMGMGEPMDNLDAVIGAIDILRDQSGPGLPASRVTVSTVGHVPGIRRLGKQVHESGWHRLNLAVSVNAPNDAIRSTIMPINRAHSMSDLRSAIEAWPLYGGSKICLEYVLIPGVNDQREHAVQIADFLRGTGEWDGRPRLDAMINVIPYNPREDSPWPAPEESSVDAFVGWVIEQGVFTKRRRTKGRDTMAACGQLGNRSLSRRITIEGRTLEGAPVLG